MSEPHTAPIDADAATLAAVIRDQIGLPVDPDYVESLARAIETSSDDETLLANFLSAVRELLAALDRSGIADEGLGQP